MSNDSSIVKILKIHWLSEEENEAVVTFEVNSKTYIAFGFPVDFDLGFLFREENLIGKFIFDISRLDICEK